MIGSRLAVLCAIATGACTRLPRATLSPSAAVEQTEQGSRPPATLVTSFDGLGVGLQGPHGRWEARNPSDNSLAVGRDYVFRSEEHTSNSSHSQISYAVFCLKKKKKQHPPSRTTSTSPSSAGRSAR